MVENLSKQDDPTGAFEEKLELALKFLSNPWKIWENGSVPVRRLVLKLAFAGPIQCCRKEGARTPQIFKPFKALQKSSNDGVFYGGS